MEKGITLIPPLIDGDTGEVRLPSGHYEGVEVDEEHQLQQTPAARTAGGVLEVRVELCA